MILIVVIIITYINWYCNYIYQVQCYQWCFDSFPGSPTVQPDTSSRSWCVCCGQWWGVYNSLGFILVLFFSFYYDESQAQSFRSYHVTPCYLFLAILKLCNYQRLFTTLSGVRRKASVFIMFAMFLMLLIFTVPFFTMFFI